MNNVADNIAHEFADETNRLTAERLSIGAVAVILAFAGAGLIEHREHPERDTWYAVIYASEALMLGGAVWLARQLRWRVRGRTLATATLIALFGCILLYHVLVQGEGEVLSMGLLYLTTGAMVLLPWGWQGQLPVAVCAVLTYALAVAMGEHVAMPLATSFLGLAGISALSVGGAAFLAHHRLRAIEQAAALRASNAALAEANQAKNQFLASVSHELRTPLTVIVGYTDLLAEGHFGTLPPEASEALGRVSRSGRNLVYLISDLLDLARIEAGRLTIRLGSVALAPVFAEMARFIDDKLEAKTVRFQAENPGVFAVVADRNRLEQILVNLLSNAAKFTQQGEIVLRAQRCADSMITIEVRDTGVGIDETDLKKLFQPFSQGTAGQKVGGVGIGLSLSARLAQAMGGTLSVQSTVGRGATFTLWLPMGESEAA